jgi:hypothetical protein
LSRRDAQMKHLIWGKDEAKYFFGEVWTGKISLKMLEKLVFWRKGCGACKIDGSNRADDRQCRSHVIARDTNSAASVAIMMTRSGPNGLPTGQM